MSNTATRVLVAVIAIPGILLLAWLGGYFWLGFTVAVLISATVEYRGLVLQKGMRTQTGLMVVFGLLLLLVFMNERLRADLGTAFGGEIALAVQWQSFIGIALGMMLVVPAVELFRNRGSALLNISATMFGSVYFGLGLGSTLGIREIFTVGEFHVGRFFDTVMLAPAQLAQLDRWGGFTMIALLASIWMCDTAAYFGGRAMGSRKLFERVSPKKTWAGAVWGLAGGIATMIAAKELFLEYLALPHAIAIGAMVGTIGQIGDLVESLFKRDANVKDSSSILPGHGGIFDRFDSLIFVSPAVFLYLDFVVFS